MFDSIVSFIKRKILRDPQERWNHQYAVGHWDGLKSEPELVRQNIVRDYFLKYKSGGSLLELGCGEGNLVDLIFQKKNYSRYVGVDISDWIIEKANERVGDEQTRFEAGDMNALKINEKFDVVLFNEAINYAKDLDQVLTDCLKNQLAKGGIFIISMHQHKRSPDIWAAVDRHFDVMDKELVAIGEHAWMVKSLKPKVS